MYSRQRSPSRCNEDIWEQLGVPIVANRAMPMESVNSGTSMTLGLIEDYPVQLGPITIHLQIQVVEKAPFEVLLGRPFFTVTNCSEVSATNGNHELRLVHPKNGNVYVFPTTPRVHKVPRAKLENSGPSSAVNFR